MSQPLIMRYGESGDTKEFATELAITKTRENQLLTAIRTKEGRLKLISWQVQRDGSILPLSDSGEDGPEVTNIALARGKTIITAYSTASNNLQLASWTVKKDGDIDTRMEDHCGDEGRYFFMAIPRPKQMTKVDIPPQNTVAYFDWLKQNQE